MIPNIEASFVQACPVTGSCRTPGSASAIARPGRPFGIRISRLASDGDPGASTTQ